MAENWNPVDTMPTLTKVRILSVKGIECVGKTLDEMRCIKGPDRFAHVARIYCVRTDEISGGGIVAVGWLPLEEED